MRKLIGPVTGAAFIAACAATTTAQAEDRSDVYIGASVGGYSLDVDDVDFDDGSRFIRGYAGVRISENLAIEGDHTRLLEADEDVFGAVSEFEADSWNVFLRPSVSLSPNIDIYGKVGWSWYDAEFRTTALGAPASIPGDDDDFAWGGGVDVHLTDNLSLRGDYTRVEIEDADLAMLSAGLTFRF